MLWFYFLPFLPLQISMNARQGGCAGTGDAQTQRVATNAPVMRDTNYLRKIYVKVISLFSSSRSLSLWFSARNCWLSFKQLKETFGVLIASYLPRDPFPNQNCNTISLCCKILSLLLFFFFKFDWCCYWKICSRGGRNSFRFYLNLLLYVENYQFFTLDVIWKFVEVRECFCNLFDDVSWCSSL